MSAQQLPVIADQRGRGLVLAGAAALLLAMAGCNVRPSPPAQAVAVARPGGATSFLLDSQASQIWLYLRADGPMSKVGHVHLITSHGLQGSIWLHPQSERSGCEFELPVATLVVDDPQERSAAGGEYSEALDEAARTSTRDHMLGERQLDAARYPKLSLRCQRVTTDADHSTVELVVTLRGHDAPLSVPLRWQRTGNTLQAEGEFTFTQTSLGLEPYSLLFGALRVADQIRARFRLVARTS